MAATIGAGATAQLGAMRINEEIDALEVIGIRTIAYLASARVVAGVVGYTGTIGYDPSRPDGTPQKLLDVSRLAKLGWRARTSFEDGLERTVAWYRENEAWWRAILARGAAAYSS